MGERDAAAHVLADEGERRGGDVLRRAEAARDTLYQGGLARAELAGEDHDVVGPQDVGQRGTGGPRVVGGHRTDRQGRRQKSSS